MKDFAAYFWMVTSFISMLIFLALFKKTTRVAHLFSAIMWFSCALWGITVPAVNIPWIGFLNGVILPINAGVFGLIAGLMKLDAVIHNKNI